MADHVNDQHPNVLTGKDRPKRGMRMVRSIRNSGGVRSFGRVCSTEFIFTRPPVLEPGDPPLGGSTNRERFVLCIFRNGFEFILTVDCSVRGHAVRDREVDPPGRAFDLSIYPRVIRPRLATPSVRSSGIRRRSEGMVRDGVPRSRDEQGALSLQDIARDIVQRKIIHGHHSGRRSRRVRDGNPACRGSGDIVLDGRAGVTSPSTVNRLRVALPGRRRVLFSRSVLPTFVVLCVILRAGPATVQGGVERHRTGFSRPAGGDAQGDPAIDPGRDHRVSRWGHDGRT